MVTGNDDIDDAELETAKALRRIATALEGIRQLLENAADEDGIIGIQIMNAGWSEDVEVTP